jgi:hypothetical protein
MRPLLWKECHANLKWAVLPALLVLGPMVLLGGPGTPPNGTGLSAWHIVAAGFGAVLGFLQVFFEAHGDPRALLLHRPLGRSRVFVAKVVAGLGLYLVGMGVPFTVLVAWCSTPGRLTAPFPWQALVPWVADLLTGVVYYFAGMLTAQREGRWYGGRCLGLPAAFLGTVLVWALPEFWMALVTLAALAALLGVAAWGSFLTGGAYAPQPPLARAALAGTLLIGLLVLGVVAKIAIGQRVDPQITYSYYLDRHGRLLLVPWKAGQGPVPPVTDLDGRVPPDLEGKRVDRNALDEMQAPEVTLNPWTHRSYRNTDRLFVEYENETLAGGERWFYVPGQGRLVGYDRKQRVPAGSYGPDGFVPADGQAGGRFPGGLLHGTRLWDAFSPDVLAFPGGVYDVDFSRHALRTLYAPTEGATVVWATRWKDPKRKAELIFVGTDRSVHLLTEAGAPVVSLPRAYDWGTYTLSAGRLEDPQRYFCRYWPRRDLDPEEAHTMPGYLLEYDAAGQEVARRVVPPHPLPEPSLAQALFGVGTPPAEAAVLVGATRYLRSEARLTRGRGRWVLLDLLESWVPSFIPGVGGGASLDVGMRPGLVPAFAALSVLSAAACGVVCFLLARRSAFGRARLVGWSLCGLAFGPAGLLLLLALDALPARVRCPGCGRPRVVDRERCEHCGAAHARPAPDGTEIFEADAAPADAALAGR